MPPFVVGHATHPDWRVALALAARSSTHSATSQRAQAPTLGFAYFTDHYAGEADALLAALRQRWPGVSWVGAWASAWPPAASSTSTSRRWC